MALLVNKILRSCLHDGPGVRTCVFLQGCPLRCRWCHNPETQPFENPDAREYNIPELVAVLERDARYWARSGGGVTITGGEPLHQAEAVGWLLTALGAYKYHRAVETSGIGDPEDVYRIGTMTDLWLWDIKAISPERSREGTGGDVETALGNLAEVLDETDTPVIVRVPLIPDFNMDEWELSLIADWLTQHRRAEIELLPGHGCASGRNLSVSPDELEWARQLFEDHGLEVSRKPTGGLL